MREQQLKERLANTKRQLRLLQAREKTIERLGVLALGAGLQRFDDITLAAEFAALAKRIGEGG